MKLRNDAWEKAKAITMSFEGKGYTQVTGNIDGMGLSLGFLQWNFGTGTLQPLLMRLFNEYQYVADATLPEGGYWLKAAIQGGYTLTWAKQIQIGTRVVDPWYSALVNLCNTPEFQSIQDDAMQLYKNGAVRMCNEFGLYTDRAFALFFDIAVQVGPYYKGYELVEEGYIEKLAAIANNVANGVTGKINGSNEACKADVRARKLGIVYACNMGRGWIGVQFNDESAFEEEKVIPDINESIEILHSVKVIGDTSYWYENCTSNGNLINGAYMQIIINRFTAMYYIGLESHEQVVNALIELKIIRDASYWNENAKPDKNVDSEYAIIVLTKMANKIKNG